MSTGSKEIFLKKGKKMSTFVPLRGREGGGQSLGGMCPKSNFFIDALPIRPAFIFLRCILMKSFQLG